MDEDYRLNFVIEPDAAPHEFPPLDLHGPGRHLLFSRRLIDTLDNLGVKNIVYYPATVVYEPTGENYDYKVANIIGLVKALDMSKSDCIIEDGILYVIRKMVFNESIPDLLMFRPAERSALMVVQDKVKEAIEGR